MMVNNSKRSLAGNVSRLHEHWTSLHLQLWLSQRLIIQTCLLH